MKNEKLRKWKMKNEKWKMKNEKLRKWKIKSEKWKVKNEHHYSLTIDN